jgi:hypothetical protein
VLSGFTAELLLGDQWLTGTAGPAQQIGMLLLFRAFYGSAARLIREIARRTGRGWPTMLLLALAFGLIEEGLLDQTLFNPHYLGLDLLSYGHVPGVNIGAPWTIFVLSLHVIWSIGAPIATVEALFPRPLPGKQLAGANTQAPWLGRLGIGLAICFYLVGAAAVFAVSYADGHFLASPAQLAAAAAAAVVAVAGALALRAGGPARHGRWSTAALLGLGATTAYQLAYDQAPDVLPAWATCLLMLAILAGGALVAVRARLDSAGLAAGAILTYCWVGWVNVPGLGVGPVVEQTLLALLAIGVVVLAAYRRLGPAVPGPDLPARSRREVSTGGQRVSSTR